ncbi:DGQHR domain-containing protein [Methylobacterium sp. GC_Met_2]|uniref:DGQHR domain-containing protein n=1 Tax=Methylobacterium sp. GC_Met_2 TaxID=2937376 RepID=UPI00226B83BC|nr:DGQHR domain-containing protein [Methylobacterium sp. GC_Met_2]
MPVFDTATSTLVPYIPIEQSSKTFFLTALPAALVTLVSYASVRRRDDEEGAVQRLLNNSRIAGIKNFALHGGDFPASIVLNWVTGRLAWDERELRVPHTARSAQIIDGQHRVAGLREAIEENPHLGHQLLPVAIYIGLSTIECADIFLSINTEQRPVPKSLVYDLYDIASDDLVDQAAARARDIAASLNEPGQAYEGLIKFPNGPRQRGGVALSTAVSAIKPLIEEKGLFDQIGATSLEVQRQIFQNFFLALKDKTGDRWEEKDNAFLYAGGFIGAVEFLQLKIIPYCVLKNSFKKSVISEALLVDRGDLIRQSEIKGLGGKDAPRKVFDRLVASFMPLETKKAGFEL